MVTGMQIIFGIYILIVAGFAVDILLREMNTYRAMCRIAIIACVPPLGILLYVVDGRRSRIRYRRPSHRHHSGLPQLIHNLCSEPLTLHNRITPLHNADTTYTAIIRAVQRAKRSICLCYYIFIDDRIGRVLCNILERKARAGVKVYVIYDDVGSWRLRRASITRLRRAGVDIRPFKPLWSNLLNGVARRNHRKIAIIDSHIAFTGGINIAERYIDGDSLGRWRDEHLSIEGDAAGRLQRVFARDWARCGGDPRVVQNTDFVHSITNSSPLQIVWNDEDDNRQTLLDTYTATFVRAERTIRISTPYFIPPQGIFDALRIALASGVKVELMIPERGDSRLTALISESYIRAIEQAGASIYRYANGFLHSKVIIIDDQVASVGTANLDYRSLCENLEVSALIYDRKVIAALREQFERDKLECQTTDGQVSNPSVAKRLLGAIARLLSPLL